MVATVRYLIICMTEMDGWAPVVLAGLILGLGACNAAIGYGPCKVFSRRIVNDL